MKSELKALIKRVIGYGSVLLLIIVFGGDFVTSAVDALSAHLPVSAR